MPDLWFAIGLAMGIVVTGFASVGSFDRGVASVRRGVISAELAARHRAIVARRSAPAGRRFGRWTGADAGMTEPQRPA